MGTVWIDGWVLWKFVDKCCRTNGYSMKFVKVFLGRGMGMNTGVCEKTLLRKIIHMGILPFRVPHQGLDCSFYSWLDCLFKAHYEHVASANTTPRFAWSCVISFFELRCFWFLWTPQSLRTFFEAMQKHVFFQLSIRNVLHVFSTYTEELRKSFEAQVYASGAYSVSPVQRKTQHYLTRDS